MEKRNKQGGSRPGSSAPLNVVFIHPDLGIGGAERLVVDAAVALKSKGHTIQLVTSHHDPKHCFVETRDGTLGVTVVGDWLPRSIFGKFYAALAYLRMILAAIWLVWFSGIPADVYFCDQISACVPILRMRGSKVIFYCHFPDQLLTKRASWVKRLYRWPIDFVEECTTGMADCVLVNSQFTDGIFQDTFQSLKSTSRQVLYPSLHCATFDQFTPGERHAGLPTSSDLVFLSINRYEKKKQIELAIAAFAALQEMLPCELSLHHGAKNAKQHLVIAGGYDDRVPENRECHDALTDLTNHLGLKNHVTFLKSIDNTEKLQLMNDCTALLYTPSNEHFGIVPLEAMYMQRPVIAVSSGGPLETVLHEATGFLCQPDEREFAVAMKKFIDTATLSSTMGKAGRDHVIKNFSFQAFTQQLDDIVRKVVSS